MRNWRVHAHGRIVMCSHASVQAKTLVSVALCDGLQYRVRRQAKLTHVPLLVTIREITCLLLHKMDRTVAQLPFALKPTSTLQLYTAHH